MTFLAFDMRCEYVFNSIVLLILGMNPAYGYNQAGMNPQGPPGQGGIPQVPGGIMSSQQQGNMNPMMGPRGPVQEMNFMSGGTTTPGQVGTRQMGPRGAVPFMQGGPAQQGQGMGGPMQSAYGRPPLGQMGQMNPGGMPNPGQMVQQGQMSQGGIPNPAQMGQGKI